SYTNAPAGIETDELFPICSMVLSRITMVPFSMTSSPFIVIILALVKAMMPAGLSTLEIRFISNPVSVIGGMLSGEPGRKVNRFSSLLLKYSFPRVQYNRSLWGDQLILIPASFAIWETGT